MRDFRRKIWFWVTETQYNRTLYIKGDKGNAIVSLQDALIERPILRLLCLTMGHEPIMDHCGIPEHDYCICCGKRMPGMATPRVPTETNPSDAEDGRR